MQGHYSTHGTPLFDPITLLLFLRYNGGPPTYERVESREESSEMYSTSIVQQLNGYHPHNQIAPDSPMVTKSKQKDAVIR